VLLFLLQLLLSASMPILTYFFDEWVVQDEAIRLNPDLYVFNRCVKRSTIWIMLGELLLLSIPTIILQFMLRRIKDAYGIQTEVTLAVNTFVPTTPLVFLSLSVDVLPSYISIVFWAVLNLLPIYFVSLLYPYILSFKKKYVLATKAIKQRYSSQIGTADDNLFKQVMENPILLKGLKEFFSSSSLKNLTTRATTNQPIN